MFVCFSLFVLNERFPFKENIIIINDILSLLLGKRLETC